MTEKEISINYEFLIHLDKLMKSVKLLIIILVIGFFLSMNFVNNSFAYNVEYPIYGKQFLKNPLVCTYEPTLQQDPYLKQWGVDRISESTRLAVQDWQSGITAI